MGTSIKQQLKAKKKKGTIDFIEYNFPYSRKPYYIIHSEDGLSYLFNDGKWREEYVTRTNRKVYDKYERNMSIIGRLEEILEQAKEGLADIGIYNTQEEYDKTKTVLDWINSKLVQEKQTLETTSS